MPDINVVTQKLAKEARTKARRMNLEKIQAELQSWLSELQLPGSVPVKSWDEFLKVHPATQEDSEATTGIRLRVTLRLYTNSHQYLISIMESLDVKDAGNHLLSVHVNWEGAELRKHKALDETYSGKFNDRLKAKHTIWAQSFQLGELADALNASAVAILGHELKAKPPNEQIGELVQPQPSSLATFPKQEDDI